MDPCPFVRVLVGNLALKIPVPAPPSRTAIHPSASPCFAKLRFLRNHPSTTAALPVVANDNGNAGNVPASSLAAAFHLSKTDIDRFARKSTAKLRLSIYTGPRGTTCGVSSGRLLGRVTVTLDLKGVCEGRNSVVVHNGWIGVGGKSKEVAQLFVTVKCELDPRFVFEFDGEPECSPQVFQIQGKMRQPVFTCNFSCRTTGSSDRHLRSRSTQSEHGSSRSWLSSFGSDRERPGKERKGWSVTVHDLSGAPVALASMVTPFVASPGTDRVSRSNPGAWLILRPGDCTWKPWGRLEAWRERGGSGDGLGYRFELIPDTTSMSAGINLAESSINASKGGKFAIDLTSVAGNPLSRSTSPGCSPRGSGDFGYALWPFSNYRGFVMSSTVAGEGKKSSKPVVEVGVQHVGCAEDAAAFVALAAAIDLSLDACRLFSHKLRPELSLTES